MAVVCKQHHFLLGSGIQQRFLRGSIKLSTLPSHAAFRRQRSSSCSNVSASSGSVSPDDAASSNTKKFPPQFRRRGQIPAEWEELSKPVPEPPNYLLIACGFCLVYLTRQSILEELVQWASVLTAMVLAAIRLIQKLATVLLAKSLQFTKEPVAWVLTWAVWSGMFVRDMYSVIVNTTSIWPTAKALLLVTLAFSIGEAANPGAVSAQPWSFFMASAFGVAVVWRVINSTVYVFLLLLLTCYSLLVQRKDLVLALLPATSMFVAIGEPPLKVATLLLYLALAVYTHWKTSKTEVKPPANTVRIVHPLLMVVAAFFVGLTAGSKFLTAWQVLWLAKS